MKKERKRTLCVLLACLLLLGLFSGCARGGGDQTEASGGKPNIIGEDDVVYYDEPITIRVVVDYYPANSAAGNQIEKIIKAFEKQNVNVTVELEKLPVGGDERSQKLAMLQAEIAKGEGPDVFLLSTKTYPESLFPDVNQAMRSGTFLDLTFYYDVDAELGIDGLNTFVMEAGMVDGVQYTLPLRYDFPVVYVVPEQLEGMNLTTEMFSSGVLDMMDTISWLENQQLAASTHFDLFRYATSFLPDYVNYDTGEVLLEAEDLQEVLESYTAFEKVRGTYEEADAYAFDGDYFAFMSGAYWAEMGNGARVGSVADAPQTAAMCQVLDCGLEMYPLTGPDGRVVAEVTYFGAIGSDTEYPDLAYNFLRRFLLEENQWEQNVDERNHDFFMFADGYCVRTAGSAGPYYQSIQSRAARNGNSGLAKLDGTLYKLSDEAFAERVSKMNAVTLTDEDVPVLQTYIDVARYPIWDQEFALVQAYNGEVYDNPQNPDFQSVAEDFISNLEQHVNGQ